MFYAYLIWTRFYQISEQINNSKLELFVEIYCVVQSLSLKISYSKAYYKGVNIKHPPIIPFVT